MQKTHLSHVQTSVPGQGQNLRQRSERARAEQRVRGAGTVTLPPRRHEKPVQVPVRDEVARTGGRRGHL